MQKRRSPFFDINGGEVLLHPDIIMILEELIQNGYDPLVSTKMPVDRNMLEDLKKIGLKKFQISLDSASESTLRQMIRAPKGYLSHMANTLQDAYDLNFSIDVNAVLTRYNSSKLEIKGLVDFLSRYKNVGRVRFNPCGYSLYKQNFNDLSLSVDAIVRIKKYIEELNAEYTNLALFFSGYDCENDYCEGRNWKTFSERALCTGNTRNIVLLPNGSVTICEELYDDTRFIIGNIRQNSLQEIWNSHKAKSLFELHKSKHSSSPCCQCSEAAACCSGAGVCWKTVLMAYGEDNWDYPDPRCPKAPIPFRTFYSR